MKNNVYLYFSGATDKTGSALAEALDIKSGRTKPAATALAKTQLVIGWGAKTDKDITLGKAAVINHPNAIKTNRNKLAALELMLKAKVNVAPFVAADKVIGALSSKTDKLQLPVIARTNFHQGGKHFWTCLTRTHVNTVLKTLGSMNKRGYFQNYIDVEAEFRLHIFRGKLIYAQRKTQRSDLADAYVRQQAEKIKHLAGKKGQTLDEGTLEHVLKYQGTRIDGADMIVRSNDKGWKFSNVKPDNVDKNLLSQACAALKALNLDFGAVDCVLDSDKKPWIIEVNTGPGLEETAFKKYVAEFEKAITAVLNPESVKRAAKPATAPKKAPDPKAGLPGKEEGGDGITADKLRSVAELLEHAESDDEAEAVRNIAKRMFG